MVFGGCCSVRYLRIQHPSEALEGGAGLAGLCVVVCFGDNDGTIDAKHDLYDPATGQLQLLCQKI